MQSKRLMKKERKSVDDRQIRILNVIREKGEISVDELAEMFHVSLMTVRRDLTRLEELDYITRFYGGAQSKGAEKVISDLSNDNVSLCRDLIGRFAAGFIQDGDSIFINGSMTALNSLRYVNGKKIRVMTNNVNALKEEYPDNVSIHLTGGEIRGHVMVGEYVMRNLLTLKADRTFIGCAAVYDNGEFRYDIPTEIGINEAMISRTKSDLYILADHTKIKPRQNRENLYGSCTYERSLTLITDDMADPDCIRKLKASGMNVIQISTKI